MNLDEPVCPHCGEPLDLHPDVDAPENGHSWVEDCAVCCHPILFTWRVDRDGQRSVEADPA